jgi:hypothetical protein
MGGMTGKKGGKSTTARMGPRKKDGEITETSRHGSVVPCDDQWEYESDEPGYFDKGELNGTRRVSTTLRPCSTTLIRR